MSSHFVYILRCADDTLYIGRTSDLQKRLKKHNGEIAGGAKYTRSRRPVSLVFFEEFRTLSESLKREYSLKQLSRKQKEELILIHK